MRRWCGVLIVGAMLAVCLLLTPAAAVAGIRISDGGIVRVAPLGNDVDGQRADAFYAGSATADEAICQEPTAVNNPLDMLQMVIANVRAELLIYPEQNEGDTDLNATGGLSLLLESEGLIPAKIGVTWAPYTEWDAGWYAGLSLIDFSSIMDPIGLSLGGTDFEITRLSLGPQYTGDGLGFGFDLSGSF